MTDETKEAEKAQCPHCEKEFDGSEQVSATQKLAGHIRMSHKRAEEISKEKSERVPLGVRTSKFERLLKYIGDDKEGRVINDSPGRIGDAAGGGWTPCLDEKGKAVTLQVGTNDDGSAITGHLMEIDKELYAEDQALKQQRIDDIDNQILRGKVEQSPGDGRYVPQQGIQISASKFAS